MDRKGLAKYMVENGCGCTPKYAEHWIKLVTNAIMDAVVNGDRVTLRGFGSFRTVKRKGKRVVTRSGQEVFAPDHVGVRYTPGQVFTKRVREQDEQPDEKVQL